MSTEPLSLQQYWDLLNNLDWTYMMSDDSRAYNEGSRDMSRAKSIGRQSPEHQALFDGFYKHVWSGEYMKTPKSPKPNRPE